MSFDEHSDPHTCGTLPVTTFSVLITQCAHHQAWSVTWSAVEQQGEEPELLQHGHQNLGPFDTKDDALVVAKRHLTAMLY